MRRNQRWAADDVSDDELRWLVKLNSTPTETKVERFGLSVFGLSERLIQNVKWPNVLKPIPAPKLFVTS